MAKDGYLIFDSDTHVGPGMDVLTPYLSSQEVAALDSLAEFKRGNRYAVGERKYERRLGDAEPRPADPTAYMGGLFKGAVKDETHRPAPNTDANPSARIADMDFEGVDVNLMLPSGWFGSFTEVADESVELSMYRAYHRWMADYCGAFPDRLTSVILLPGRDVEGGLAELRRVAKEPWAMGVMLYAPYGTPLDHPKYEPYWALAEENDLPIIIHTFTVMPPYAPGGLDSWDNLFLQRTAAHPWCGMRNMASIIGAGILDRYPRLRLGVLEAGQGWLPSWIKRLDEHAHSMAAALPPLQQLPSEYVTSGRYFQSIELNEGEGVTKSVMDLLGDDILMYASDYPHSESWFPVSVEAVMGWDLPHETKRKFLWDNALRYYSRYRPSGQLLATQAAV